MKNGKWILLLIVFIFIVLRLPSLSLPLERDEGAYAYIGWEWINGNKLPYKDMFEMKPPLIHFVYGLISKGFGNTAEGIRFVSLIWSILIIAAFYLIVRAYHDENSALWMTGVLAFYMADYWTQATGFNAEMLVLLPMILFLDSRF